MGSLSGEVLQYAISLGLVNTHIFIIINHCSYDKGISVCLVNLIGFEL